MATALVAFALTACTQEADIAPVPAFPQDTGQLPRGTAAVEYAPAPYGISKGSTIQNFEFVGYTNSVVDIPAQNPMKSIQLADFYNPTGDGVFPEGSPYGAGTPKPKGLLIVVSAVWCSPCNYEAATTLPALYAKYKPNGGEFFLVLADSATPGVPAESKNLYQWDKKYKLDYPSALDPSSKLAALFEADAFPANMIIRTSDMKIMDVSAGAPPEGSTFWKTYEKIIAGLL
jgi:hypothetical protein